MELINILRKVNNANKSDGVGRCVKKRKSEIIEARVKECAKIMISEQCTIRQAAKKLYVSKSTVENDIRRRMIKIDPVSYDKVVLILEKNKRERAYRGGEALRLKRLKNK